MKCEWLGQCGFPGAWLWFATWEWNKIRRAQNRAPFPCHSWSFLPCRFPKPEKRPVSMVIQPSFGLVNHPSLGQILNLPASVSPSALGGVIHAHSFLEGGWELDTSTKINNDRWLWCLSNRFLSILKIPNFQDTTDRAPTVPILSPWGRKDRGLPEPNVSRLHRRLRFPRESHCWDFSLDLVQNPY